MALQIPHSPMGQVDHRTGELGTRLQAVTRNLPHPCQAPRSCRAEKRIALGSPNPRAHPGNGGSDCVNPYGEGRGAESEQDEAASTPQQGSARRTQTLSRAALGWLLLCPEREGLAVTVTVPECQSLSLPLSQSQTHQQLSRVQISCSRSQQQLPSQSSTSQTCRLFNQWHGVF